MRFLLAVVALYFVLSAYALEPELKAEITRSTVFRSAVYGDAIRQKIETFTPRSAREHRGRHTKLRCEFKRNGDLISVVVTKSSGFRDTDTEAIEIVKASAPFPPAPVDVEPRAGILVAEWDFYF